jgi:hypothetical protein
LKPAFALLAALPLCACATAGAPFRTIEAPVPVTCAPNLGPEPAYPDTDAALAAAPDLYARVRLLVAGRLMRIARDAVKTAALSACAGTGL